MSLLYQKVVDYDPAYCNRLHSLDLDRVEAGYKLETMLGLKMDDKSDNELFGGWDGPFNTYPNVLNRSGIYRCDSAKKDATSAPLLFRDLPNGGRRSPRSRLACSMAEDGYLPFVHGLSRSELCANIELAEQLEDPDTISFYDMLPSDHASDLGEDISDMARTSFLDEPYTGGSCYEDHCHILRLLDCDGPDSARADYWREWGWNTLNEMFEEQKYNNFLCDDDGNDFDGVDELRDFIQSLMSRGGSINSAIVTARLSEVEDQYLASEAEVEAAEDLRCALLRLKEGTIEYVPCVTIACNTLPLSSSRFMMTAKTLIAKFSASQRCINAARSLVACALTVSLAPVPQKTFSRPLHVSEYAGNLCALLFVLGTLKASSLLLGYVSDVVLMNLFMQSSSRGGCPTSAVPSLNFVCTR